MPTWTMHISTASGIHSPLPFSEKGVSLETVSVLLGHSSVKITERHYKPWVKKLQTKLEEEVTKIWSATSAS